MFTCDPAPGSIDPRSILEWSAEQFRRIETALGRIGKWQPYQPIWTSDGTQPSLGNGSLIGAFLEIGSYVVADVTLTMGSTTTYGTGTYSLSLPRSLVNRVQRWQGVANLVDTGTAAFPGLMQILPGQATMVGLTVAGAGVSPTAPFTWGNTDVWRATIGYPTA